MKKSIVGKVEQERNGFGYLYSVWISKDEAFLTKDLDNARIMSMLAIIMNKLGIDKKQVKNKGGIYENKFFDKGAIYGN